MTLRLSNNGSMYGSNFEFISPGRYPKSLLLNGTTGLAKKICLKSFLFSKAADKARIVFPVQAFPDMDTN